MAGLKRTDNKGRILKDGETQRKDGTYRFTYTDADGVRHDVYSKRLVPTDRLPPGCKDDLCLREKERKINRDLEDGIKAAVENKATLRRASSLTLWKLFTPSSTPYLLWPSVIITSVSTRLPERWRKSKRATTGRSQSVTR